MGHGGGAKLKLDLYIALRIGALCTRRSCTPHSKAFGKSIP